MAKKTYVYKVTVAYDDGQAEDYIHERFIFGSLPIAKEFEMQARKRLKNLIKGGKVGIYVNKTTVHTTTVDNAIKALDQFVSDQGD